MEQKKITEKSQKKTLVSTLSSASQTSMRTEFT